MPDISLQRLFPHVELGQWPTPVQEGPVTLDASFSVKRDDQSARFYGGNKVRKLEFLCGRAKAEGAEAVITFGAAGSNHALATAIHAGRVGLRCHSVLVPQVKAKSIRRNLLRGYAAGAMLHPCANRRETVTRVAAIFREEWDRAGRFPHVIPAGGSSPVGVLGFVNAAFELAEQLGVGGMPDVVYVPAGTMGTCIGLLVGFQLLDVQTRVEAISVTTAPFSCPEKARALHRATANLLRAADPTVLPMSFPEDRFSFREEFLGEGYGVYTREGVAAVDWAREQAGLKLEGTYTGKALAALLADAERGALAGKRVLFWNTYNGRDFSADIAGIDYRSLPAPFHTYFEDEVQPLDRT